MAPSKRSSAISFVVRKEGCRRSWVRLKPEKKIDD